VRSKHEKPNFRSLPLNFLAKFRIYGTLSPSNRRLVRKPTWGTRGKKRVGGAERETRLDFSDLDSP
jgi:hypothetical protein